MARLEGWTHALPGLVNGRCAVLRGQVRRAGGGLHYATYREFAAALTWLLDHPDQARQFGRQGLAVPDNVHHVLDMGLAAGRAVTTGAGPLDRARWDLDLRRFSDHVVED